MNITQVYLTPDCDTSDNQFRVKYQNETTYIQLFVEECLRKNKIDLGAFNRLVFSEGGDPSRDFTIVGNNAMPVAIKNTYKTFEFIKTDREAHEYYIGKLLEGFNKLDSHFKSSFVEYLKPLIDAKYKNDLHFEKKMAAKRIKGYRLQAIGRYNRNSFALIINVYLKNELTNSKVIYECEPDMFIVKYHVYKVKIDDVSISIINKIDDKTLELKVAEII